MGRITEKNTVTRDGRFISEREGEAEDLQNYSQAMWIHLNKRKEEYEKSLEKDRARAQELCDKACKGKLCKEDGEELSDLVQRMGGWPPGCP